LKTISVLLYILIALNFISCSSSVEETREEKVNNEEEEKYIFDEIPINETVKKEYFIIQIGAFTTKQNAESFAEESRIKLNEEVSVTYSSDVNLFIVRLDKEFKIKKEAEKVRNRIRLNDEFKDAWIVTLAK
jgi:hypothetical protein